MRWSIPNTRIALKWMFVLQITIAVGMVVLTAASHVSIPTGFPRKVTEYTPVKPGDQSRPYEVRQFRQVQDENNPAFQLPNPASLPDKLEFSMQSDAELGEVLVLSGQIEEGDSKRLSAFLDDLPLPPDYLSFHSPGGIVSEAIRIGGIARERELNTVLFPNSICLSSCPYAFAGGLERAAFTDAIVGLHQHYFDQSKLLPAVFAVEAIQRGQAMTMEHLQEMGVDPAISILAMKTAPEDLYILLPEELEAYKLATRILEGG